MDNYVIAFIDFLGSEHKILNDNNYTFFNRIKSIYDDVISMLSEVDKQHIKIKIFSDNIVVARKITDNNENRIINLHHLISISAMFQLYSVIKSNCLLKGGITIGEFYIDDIMVWGKGLVEAYKIESDKTHTYPTINIGGEAKELVSSHRDRFPIISHDGMFVDYLQMNDKNTEKNGILGLHRYSVLKIANEINNDALYKDYNLSDSIKSKIDWLGGYHNHNCKIFKKQSLMIDEDDWLQQFKEMQQIFNEVGKLNFHFHFKIPQGIND